MPPEAYAPLLQPELLSERAIRRLLSGAGFGDWRAAASCLRRWTDAADLRPLLPEVLPYLLAKLDESASPDRVLVSFDRFSQDVPDRQAFFAYLGGNQRAMDILVTLFAGSQFLTEILLRHPAYLERLVGLKNLAHPKSVADLRREAQQAAAASETFEEKLDALRHFQRWELLRIGACDLLALYDLPTITLQLSNLADALIQTCLELLCARHNLPESGFVVVALGKLGGRELNYSSDIDLLFLADPDAAPYYKLAQRLIDALAGVTTEGFLYRVDMRLRPWGKVGALVSSVNGYLKYLDEHAQLWEKQALLKARPAAGDDAVWQPFAERVSAVIYHTDPELVRSEVWSMKQLTETHLAAHGRDWGEVKLGEGSIRDVEFTVQYLQMVHAESQPGLRTPNTLEALTKLVAAGLLSADEGRVLKDGYIFLRAIEHHLQMMHYRQTNTLPAEKEALLHLARRLGFRGKEAGDRFLARYEQHCVAVRSIYLHHLEGSENAMDAGNPQPAQSNPQMSLHIARMDASYTGIFNEHEIKHHAALAARLNDDNLVEVDAHYQEGNTWQVTIIAYDYPGELSLICGLLFVHGFSILNGYVFTYESLLDEQPPSRNGVDWREKIVDMFIVQPVRGEVTPETWARYSADLADLLRLLDAGKRREARGKLAKQVAMMMESLSDTAGTLYPVDVQIDNDTSARYTVLRIDAPDTRGFLYAFTNALAINRINVVRVAIHTTGSQIHDVFFVTDSEGRKITAEEKQRELRAAIVLIKQFTHLLPHSPDPESALLHFRGFIEQLFERPNWPDELTSLERPEVLNALARLLGISNFLWEDFLRLQYTNLYPIVRDVDALDEVKMKGQLQDELRSVLGIDLDGEELPPPDVNWRDALNAFKDREMFRIDMRHILGIAREFDQFSRELTDLAEVVVNAASHLCQVELQRQYGTPRRQDGQPCPVSVCALGKCGGVELGFASDIELMFIYGGGGTTGGAHSISSASFYEKLVENFIGSIYARREGIFQIDLQLRPFGSAGSMAVSLDAFRRYFALDGPAWAYERQALIKLRPIAGDAGLGQQITALRDEFVYNGQPFDVTAMRAMRERQIRHLVSGGTLNVKFSPGGLVDVEYLVQGLQITHGAAIVEVRQTNTRRALAALAENDILSEEDYTKLRKAHTFLRWVIDSLRVVRGNAKDMTVPPTGSEEFAFLARRMMLGDDRQQLHEDILRYMANVQELNTRLLG